MAGGWTVGAITGEMKLKRGKWNQGVRSVKDDVRQMKRGVRDLEDRGKRGISLNTKAFVARAAAASASILAVGVALKKVVRISIELESAFTGVRKTVDATEQQFGKLEKNLMGLSKRLPTTAKELFKIAEIAGQLGVNVENLEEFTEQIAILGETTNVAGEEAALMLAQWANVTGLPLEDIDRLVATIVGVGNAAATTERHILEMGSRLTGIMSVLGGTDAQIVGLSASMASVGLNAEMAGTAFSTLMTNIAQAVDLGSDDLESFAAVAGKTAEDFAKSFKKDATTAVLDVVEGLKRYKEAGGPVFQLMKDLGVEATRESRLLLTLGGAMDVVRGIMNKANKEWDDGTAAVNEMNERLKDTQSQMDITKNKVVSLADAFGDFFNPAVEWAAKHMGNLAEATDKALRAWDDLPQGAITGATPLGFGIIKMTEFFKSNELASRNMKSTKVNVADVVAGLRELAHVADAEVSPATEKLAGMLQNLARGIDPVKEKTEETTEELDAFRDAVEVAVRKAAREADIAAKALARLETQARSLRESVLPSAGIRAAVGRVTGMAQQFPAIVDEQVVTAKFREIFERFREQGIDATTAVRDVILSIPEQFRASWIRAVEDIEMRVRDLNLIAEEKVVTEQRGEAAERGMSILGMLQPGGGAIAEVQGMLDDLAISVEDLQAAGEIVDVDNNMLSVLLWERLGLAGSDAVREWISALDNPQLKALLEKLLLTSEIDQMIDAWDSLGASVLRFGTALDRVGARSIGKIVRGLGLAAKASVRMTDAIVDSVKNFKDMKDVGASTLSKVTSGIQGMSSALGAAATAIELAAELFGFMGDKGEEELTGIEKAIDEVRDAIDQWADQLADAFVEAVRTGKFEISNLVDQMMSDLLSIGISTFLMDPLVDFLGGMLFAKGGQFKDGNLVPHAKGGGHVTSGPEIFSFDGGRQMGIRGEAGTEVVMPAERMSDGTLGVSAVGLTGGNVTVNVHDHRGQEAEPVEVQESSGPEGEKILDIIIQDRMRANLAGGDLDVPVGRVLRRLGVA